MSELKVTQVISHLNGWEILNSTKSQQYKDISQVLSNLSFESFASKPDYSSSILNLLDNFYGELRSLEWKNGIIDSMTNNPTVLNTNVYTKRGVACTVLFSEGSKVFDWIYQRVVTLFEFDSVEIPVLIVPTRDLRYDLPEDLQFSMSIEQISYQLPHMSALSHPYPFVILGVEYSDPYWSAPDILEFNFSVNRNAILNRTLEFPPDLYEAGCSILSFFSTYLSSNYKEQKAKVTIQQDDEKKSLRMIVESETGDKEIIEEAYEEYRLIVSKQAPPEQFTSDEKLILKLHNRIDILELQVKQEMRLRMVEEGHSDKYFKALDKSLNQKSDITVHVHQETTNQNEARAEAVAKAKASATSTAEAHQNLSLAIGGVNELKDLIPAGSAEARELQQLEQGLEKIAEEQDPKKVQRSPTMSNFQKVLDDVASGEGNLAKAVRAAENGYSIFKKLAKIYNKVAPWCMLPSVPEEMLK